MLILGQARKSGEAEAADESTAPATNGDASAPTNVPGQVIPLTETTNEALSAQPGQEGTITVDPAETGKSNAPRPRKQRGPPEDGVPSKTKVMVANLPYDLREEKVSYGLSTCATDPFTKNTRSFSRSSPTTTHPLPRSLFAPSRASWSGSSRPATSRAKAVVSVS